MTDFGKCSAASILLISATLLLASCGREATRGGDATPEVAAVLDSMNAAAARADFDAYFRCFDEEAVFLGTDATERWDKRAFMAYAKPYFDRGKAWTFTSIERHIVFTDDGSTAWFDELLDTQMSICRGSGVLQRKAGAWSIRQYVLSMAVPNSIADTVIALKRPLEAVLLK